MKFLFLGLVGGVLFAVLFGLFEELYYRLPTYDILSGLRLGLFFALSFAPFFGLIGGLLGGLTGGLSSDMLDERNRATPNQGIRRSARHSLLAGLFGTLGGGVICGLTALLVTVLVDGLGFVMQYGLFSLVLYIVLPFALLIGPLVGLVSGLRGGGIASIQHAVLRVLLWRANLIPWNYPRFLDYAAERILLRKVGGGYIFVHRLLLEYFASLDTTSSSGVLSNF